MDSYLVLPLVQAALSLALMPFVLRGHRASTTHRLFAFYLLALTAHGSFIFLMRSSPTTDQAHYWGNIILAIAPIAQVILWLHL